MDDQKFKEALRQWVAGVTIVTTRDGDTMHGMTASSFTSVSINPHLILVALAQHVYSHALIEKSGIFAANILHTGQVEWAKRFAGMYPEIEDRFFDIDHTTAETGAPILPGSLAYVDCTVEHAYPAGDHTIFVGRVVAASGPGGNDALLYHNRMWGQFAPTDDQ